MLAEVIKSHVVTPAHSGGPVAPESMIQRQKTGWGDGAGVGEGTEGLESARGQQAALCLRLPATVGKTVWSSSSHIWWRIPILKIVLLSYCYLLQVKLFTYKMHSSNSAYIILCSGWKISGDWTKADNIIALGFMGREETEGKSNS